MGLNGPHGAINEGLSVPTPFTDPDKQRVRGEGSLTTRDKGS